MGGGPNDRFASLSGGIGKVTQWWGIEHWHGEGCAAALCVTRTRKRLIKIVVLSAAWASCSGRRRGEAHEKCRESPGNKLCYDIIVLHAQKRHSNDCSAPRRRLHSHKILPIKCKSSRLFPGKMRAEIPWRYTSLEVVKAAPSTCKSFPNWSRKCVRSACLQEFLRKPCSESDVNTLRCQWLTGKWVVKAWDYFSRWWSASSDGHDLTETHQLFEVEVTCRYDSLRNLIHENLAGVESTACSHF